MKMRLPFLVLALVASAAGGQAAAKKPKSEKSKPSATAAAKRKNSQATEGKSATPNPKSESKGAIAKSPAEAKSDLKPASSPADVTSAKPTSVAPEKPATIPPALANAMKVQPLTAGEEAEVVGDVLPEVPERRSDLKELAKASAREVSSFQALKPEDKRTPMDNAGEEPTKGWRGIGANATLTTADLRDLELQPMQVQVLVRQALELTTRNLRYRFGSADPSTGGLDCSGVIQYLLKNAGVPSVPRDSTGLYLWAEKAGTLQKVRPESLEDPALQDLRPGDLMFWEGTYDVKRDPPISHVMIYLGREKKTGLPVMMGSSDGRTYAGIRRSGVSVFDFKLPKAGSKAKFVGFARVPGLPPATAGR
jgi:peptidoglycan DL-endopeptidase CwlO